LNKKYDVIPNVEPTMHVIITFIVSISNIRYNIADIVERSQTIFELFARSIYEKKNGRQNIMTM
jgi:arabinogalactan endo-1,4-beta-galactosidase